jgi:cation diffusion facilitator family transporter
MSRCCENKGCEIEGLRDKQRSVLIAVLLINGGMFFVEFIAGIIAGSTSLLADSLDMFGDASVYALSLYVIDKGPIWKARSALVKGIFIAIFGLYVFGDAIYKILHDITPVAKTMGIIGIIALVSNLICLALLLAHRDDDINMRSTWICSTNDIIANTGVLIAAYLVFYFQSKWPDIILGGVLSVVFLKSAYSIIRDARKELSLMPAH